MNIELTQEEINVAWLLISRAAIDDTTGLVKEKCEGTAMGSLAEKFEKMANRRFSSK